MITKKLLPVLAIACCALSASQPFMVRSAPIDPHRIQLTHITPCAPGVIYVQFKIGSPVPKGITPKGEVTQSAGGGAFQNAMNRLGLHEIIPFDAHASKDSISHALGIDRMYCLYYSNSSINPHTALAMLLATGEIECGSVRYLFPETSQPNDPDISYQYALTKMNVFNAWNMATGDTSIVIADVDCAINIDHEDLKNQIKYNWGEIGLDAHGQPKQSNDIDDDSDGYIDNWEGWDVCGDVPDGAVFQPNNNPRPREDGASHGTHTAGCMLAEGNNRVGIAGVAYGCKLLPIKAAGSDFESISAGYEGIHYASTHGARIINCSWGGTIGGLDTALANLFLYEAHDRGALVVAAAGNGIPGITNSGVSNDINPEYPGNGPYVLSVGSTDQSDAPSYFSNFGHSVSVWAPGTQIFSCDYTGVGSNSAYSAEDGTSFASPNAAGVAALLWSQHHDWLPEFISRQLIATCDNVVNPSDRTDYWGRLNAANALTASLGPGLIVASYSIDGVASDSLRPGQNRVLSVTFKNVMSAGSNLSATPLSSIGAQLSSSPATLGSMNESSTATGIFHITRTGVFSEGNLPVSFAVGDGSNYTDTISMFLPLARMPGFVLERAGNYGSSIFRLSNTSAWAAFGQASTNQQTGVTTIFNAQFAREGGSVWSDTSTLLDGTNPPYCVTALDSNTAFFGSGPPGGTASVMYTTDGGQHFTNVDVSTFAAFVNTIHFFDSQNGILIGDPKSNRWGIGVTTDGGQSWNPLAKPVTVGGTTASWNNATAWVGDNGWYGTNSRQILRTTNRGQTWLSVKTGTNQNSLGIGFDDDARHGLACYQPVSGNGTYGMTVTTDSGASWQQLTTLPAPGIEPGSVQFIPNSNTAILTSNMGVYRTTDFGTTWSSIGIPVSYNSTQAEISISRGQGEFVVSINSPNNGVASYAEAMPDSIQAGVPEWQAPDISFDVNPNPLEGTTVFSFTLPSSDRASIAIYDAVGRKVFSVVDKMFEQGENHITFGGRLLPPGAYYAVFETASGAHLTRAITVLR
ncbi:MAG TPA: S8 family serine peptidase [Candidatus Kapabacteria bacterium]|nr:S8 family serine peptidase [Candidatus Kapabacteria bacterium]